MPRSRSGGGSAPRSRATLFFATNLYFIEFLKLRLPKSLSTYVKDGDSMSYDGTVRTSEVFVPLTEKYILMTYFRRDMSLSTQSKHSHLENKGPLNQRLLQRESSSKAFTILSSMLALALTLAPTVLPAEVFRGTSANASLGRRSAVPGRDTLFAVRSVSDAAER